MAEDPRADQRLATTLKIPLFGEYNIYRDDKIAKWILEHPIFAASAIMILLLAIVVGVYFIYRNHIIVKWIRDHPYKAILVASGIMVFY